MSAHGTLYSLLDPLFGAPSRINLLAYPYVAGVNFSQGIENRLAMQRSRNFELVSLVNNFL